MKQDSNFADSESVLVRIRGKGLNVQMLNIAFDQAIYGFSDAPPKFYRKTLNELISFAADL